MNKFNSLTVYLKLTTILVSAFSSMVSAQSDVNQISTTHHLIQVFIGLVLVLGLILGLAWLARWTSKINSVGQKNQIQVISQVSLGVKEKLVVIKASESFLLLGITPQNISLIHTFKDGEFEFPKEGEKQSGRLFYGGGSFQDVLAKLAVKGS